MQPETKLAGLPGQSPARGFGRWLVLLASGYLVTGLATAALSGVSTPVIPATGPFAAQFQHVHQHLLVYEASFVASSRIALFAVPLMLALAFGPAAQRRPGVREHVAAAFFTMYAPLAARFLAEKTPLRSGSWFLLASSAGCVLTFLGQALGNGILIPGNLAAAALTIPFAIAAIRAGRRLMRGVPMPQAPGREAGLTSRAA